MTYTAEISRTNPSGFLFLIDQSGSMTGTWGANSSKMNTVADVLNRLLQNLIIKCSKSEGVKDYFYVGVLGYGNDVGTAFGGVLADGDLVPISTIADNPLRIEEKMKKMNDGAGGIITEPVKFPIWVDPVASGGTPMCSVFSRAYEIISSWIEVHPDCFPPVIINITDGQSTDGNPSPIAEKIKELSTVDGNVLLFNIHISSANSEPIMYPDNVDNINDEYAQLLFSMSSVLPPYLQEVAAGESFRITAKSRGYGFNADSVSLIEFLDIGTRPANLR